MIPHPNLTSLIDLFNLIGTKKSSPVSGGKLTLACRSLLAGLLSLQACTPLVSKYERPELPVQSAYPRTDVGKLSSLKAVADVEQKSKKFSLSWQDFVRDAKLKEIINLALKNNRDLRVVALQVQKAQAQYQVSSADLFPKINATLANTATKTPANLSQSGQVSIMHDYSAGLGFSSYELDMFGRLQSLKDSAFQQYLSTSEAAQTVRVSLIAQVATQYLTLSADRLRLQLAEQTLNAQQQTLEMDKRRFELGVISELDLSLSRSTVESAKVDIAKYKTLVAQDTNLLTLLAGAALPPELLISDFLDTPTVIETPAGIPSDLLAQRPDILDAEHQLIAANANIGAARAAYFPSISMTTFYGTASPALNGLFSARSRSWLFMPQINLPIFDGGRISANLKIAQSNQKIAINLYEKLIQNAFKEVADALALQENIKDELSSQKSLVQATELSLKLSQARYDNGIYSYLNVLDSQRSLYAAKQNLITLMLSSYTNEFTLFKALGGGSEKLN
jgi:multidrug efflux system outer membrane protein